MKTLFLNIFIALALFTPPSFSNDYKTWNISGGTVYGLRKTSAAYEFDSAVYHVFVPSEVLTIRGVLVHQHGCTMEGVGASTAFDIQYQAFAKKWGLVVVGPDLYSTSGNCFKWRDTEQGSADALFRTLSEVGQLSGHPETAKAPLLLWGHSGGGYWALSMLKNYPERLMAVFAYSPAFDPSWAYPAAALKVPLLIRHAGAGDGNSNGVGCWATASHTFGRLRQAGGYAAVALTPGQNHNYSFVRYMAIPFYEAVLAQRQTFDIEAPLKDMDASRAWLGDTVTAQIAAASVAKGNPASMCWLPDEATARLWQEYVRTGTVTDRTPPPPPYALKVEWRDGARVLSWKADADVESGLRCFMLTKDGAALGRFPASGDYQRFDTNGDNAVPALVAPMTYKLTGPNAAATFTVQSVNAFGLKSAPTTLNYQP